MYIYINMYVYMYEYVCICMYIERSTSAYQRELRSRDDDLLARDKRVRSLEAEVGKFNDFQ